ncbi:MAG: fused MFS/spermidine synthase [Candidatus Doudnabacteria bacterium]|nr:fused MFS/spermidine synthase [Candidatus Doudnabacteria bacterium]
MSIVEQHAHSHRRQLLFGLPIVLGSFLLFQIQPIIIKTLLPQFGGSAATWTVALLFFQTALLLGYIYAHYAGRLGNRKKYTHVAIAAGVFVFTLLLKPWSGIAVGTASPILNVLVALAATIGLPYILLAGTSPLFQKLASPFNPIPYRYYALSNAASLAALVSFPLFELLLPLRALWGIWMILFGIYTGLVMYAHAWAQAHRTGNTPSAHRHTNRVRAGTIVQWILLAALGTLLLTSITTMLSEDIAATPLIWIVPLALYLLSFIICFERTEWSGHRHFAVYTLCSAFIMLLAMQGGLPHLIQQVLAASLLVFCGCVLVHGELARGKPDATHLTRFYVCIAIGGMVGGLLGSVVAPLFLPDYLELHVSLGAGVLLSGFILFQADKKIHMRRLLLHGRFIPYVIMAVVIPLLLVNAHARLTGPVLVGRNFYGVLKISEFEAAEQNAWRVLMHGNTNHGTQYIHTAFRTRPTSYYGPNSGIGRLLHTYEQQPNTRVGIIGLGTGTLAAYGKPGDNYQFYEINPAVLSVAQSSFTYLADSRAQITTHIGDARLVLTQQTAQQFDVLVVDAFSGDAIPIHLLTNEALRIYLRQLNPEGVLAIHISNRHVDLKPVIGALAKHHGLQLLHIASQPNGEGLETPSSWVLLSQTKKRIGNILTTDTSVTDTIPMGRMWTDQYSSILPLLK